jgi:hypothetical protein
MKLDDQFHSICIKTRAHSGKQDLRLTNGSHRSMSELYLSERETLEKHFANVYMQKKRNFRN